MKIKELANDLNVSENLLKILITFSVIWLILWSLLFIPLVRSLIIKFGETLVHRPLTHNVWHDRFINLSIAGIIVYIVFALLLCYEKAFLRGKDDKKNYRFLVPLITAFSIFIIMFHANWLFGDDHGYITTTVINKYIFISPYLQNGRFYFLGHFHYNFLLLFFQFLGINTGLPVTAHFALIAIFYAVSIIFLYSLFKKTEPAKTRSCCLLSVFFIIIFPLTSHSFVSVFMDLIYPETVVIMLFSIFMLMLYKARERDNTKYYAIAFIAAVYASYCKEPIFGALLIIALTNLIFRIKEQTKKEKYFYILLIANGIIFMGLYYFLSFKNATSFYNTGRVESSDIMFICRIFFGNPILILIFLLGFVRFFYVLFKHDKRHLYYDSLLFAAIGYVFAYILLKLNEGYFFLPAVILALPSIVYWTKYLYQKKLINSLFLLFPLFLICCLNIAFEIQQVKDTLHQRQEFMPYINNLFSKYNDGINFIWYESDNALTNNTLYKEVRDWKKYTENVFLNYMNGTTEKDFFVISNDITKNETFDKNALFFYPIDNDQGQPMPEIVIEKLIDNDFTLYSDLYGILIYENSKLKEQ